MHKEAFVKLDEKDANRILDALNSKFDSLRFDPARAVVLAIDLNFYKGWKLLEIADHTHMPSSRRFAVYAPALPEKSVVLDFTHEPISALNKTVPIALDAGNIADYLRFFFSYARGRHGMFLIAENIDDIDWREDPPPSARKTIGRMITPITLLKTGPDGNYHLSACFVFKNALFKSGIEVTPEGGVTLTDEQLLLEDLPVVDHILGQ